MTDEPTERRKPRYNGKHPGGRPPKYNPNFHPASLIQAAKDGLSVTAWCGSIGINRDTATNWADEYPEFSSALQIAKGERLFKFEQLAQKMMTSSGLERPTGGQAALAMFFLKNHGPDEFKDKAEVNHTGGISIEKLLVVADARRDIKEVTPAQNDGLDGGSERELPKPDK